MPISIVRVKDKSLVVFMEGTIYKMPIDKSKEYLFVLMDGGSDKSSVMPELEILQYGAKQEDVFRWK